MKSLAIFPLILAVFFSSCAHRHKEAESSLVSLQLIDRNGLTETISSKERLGLYQKIDYLSYQPYQKVLRVYSKDQKGKSPSKITSYHPNGGLWQYLEAVDGRANGYYREWYPNGQLRLEAYVIEGPADINEVSQGAWLFDGIAKVYRESGELEAEIPYEKGLLQNRSCYYYPSGKLLKVISYDKDLPHGDLIIYNEEGLIKEKIGYQVGKKEGEAVGFFPNQTLAYKETYENDLLKRGSYFNPEGQLIAQVENGEGTQILFDNDLLLSRVRICSGVVDGKVEVLNKQGQVEKYYHLKEGSRNGEELIFYPSEEGKERVAKISLSWQNDMLHGTTRTWYPTGVLESQREMSHNKKHGTHCGWYEDGDVMLIEEYENDLLIKGSYFKKGSKLPISTIDSGSGTATLYDKNGIFLKKITYDRGRPMLEE